MAPNILDEWRRKKITLKKGKRGYPTFHEFVTFLQNLTDSLNDPAYGIKSSKSRSFNAAAVNGVSNPVDYCLSTSSIVLHMDQIWRSMNYKTLYSHIYRFLIIVS